ncbi:hypothetical protein L218DRAFT_409821 [Marasmius fiardii PR-910]|nr:hypothetical protein L218DRAFT_409821 [Marasmius fiardii PR-910]
MVSALLVTLPSFPLVNVRSLRLKGQSDCEYILPPRINCRLRSSSDGCSAKNVHAIPVETTSQVPIHSHNILPLTHPTRLGSLAPIPLISPNSTAIRVNGLTIISSSKVKNVL